MTFLDANHQLHAEVKNTYDKELLKRCVTGIVSNASFSKILNYPRFLQTIPCFLMVPFSSASTIASTSNDSEPFFRPTCSFDGFQ